MVASFYLLTLPVSAAGETVYSLPDMTGCYKTQGRVYQTIEKLYLDWSASGIEFLADCSGDVSVTFDVESIGDGGCYFTVIVDGIVQDRSTCWLAETGVQTIRIASDLPAGEHRFELYRQTEIGAAVSLTGVSLSGILQAAPKQNDLYIEFVGDSITTAYGNLADSSTQDPGAPRYTDATQGYAYLTTRELNADFSLVAVRGVGVTSGEQAYSMYEAYSGLRYPVDTGTEYEFPREPDVIVLALGTNDRAVYGNPWNDSRQGFLNMLMLIRQKNPTAKIVWIHGMMTDVPTATIEEVVAEAGGKAEGMYTLSVPSCAGVESHHPDVVQQQAIADKLSTYIRKLTVPAPLVQEQTLDRVTLKTVDGYEYSYDGQAWQTSPVFSGLVAGKTYVFYQRKAETQSTNAGTVSVGVEVTPITVTTTTAVTTTTTTAATTTTTATTALTTTTMAIVIPTTITTAVPTTTTTEPTTTTVSTLPVSSSAGNSVPKTQPSVSTAVSSTKTSTTTAAKVTTTMTTETSNTSVPTVMPLETVTTDAETTVGTKVESVTTKQAGVPVVFIVIIACFCAVAAGAIIIAVVLKKKQK